MATIRLGVACSYKQYTVTFMSGSSVVVTYTHRYGDTLSVPADPVKVGYVFEGWSPAILPVTEDVTYTAVFTPAKVTDGGENNPSDSYVSRLLYAGTVCYYMVLYLVIPAAAVGLTVLILERRKYRSGRQRRK